MIAAVLASALSVIPQPTHVDRLGGEVLSGMPVVYRTDSSIDEEGYRLIIASNRIEIACSGNTGRYYAGVTLDQLKRPSGSGECFVYPCVLIEDSPAYKWRGIHFDDCRHFFGKQTLKKTLDVMARYKLNRLHWHLTDDQGWRLDIPGYPDLVKYAAVRSSSPRHGEHPHFSQPKDRQLAASDGVRYGPFYYTEEDVREIVAYADERHIQIVPEIELPGHFQAVFAAYPEFACCPENVQERDPLCVWGISNEVMCLGNDGAVKFMENVLDYVCRVFPGNVVHIGGDECPQMRWKTCPKCQARIVMEKLGDEHGLQPWITRHFVHFLEARGKRALGWDEYLLGNVPKTAIGMSWRERRDGAGHELVSGAAAALRGHDVVMTPCSYCYLDMRQGLANDPFDYIGGNLTLARCYSFDPVAGVPESARTHILGQGNNWSEYTWNEHELAWKMWPRGLALAEVFWTGSKRPGFADFRRRASEHRKHLVQQGVNCAPME